MISARLGSLACILLLWGCGTNLQELPVAGGDDMGNFLQASIQDSDGRITSGRVMVVSDRDTAWLFPDAQGLIRLPMAKRAWLDVRTANGRYLLDSPPDSGTLGILRTGRTLPLEGWLGTTDSLAIRGLGAASRSGGFFRFREIPPGLLRLQANGVSRVSMLLRTDAPSLQAGTDTLRLPPLRIAGTQLLTALPGDTVACGTGCPTELWTRSSFPLTASDTTWGRVRIADAADSSAQPAFGLRSVTDRGNSVTFEVGLRGTNTVPELRLSVDSLRRGTDTLHPVFIPLARVQFFGRPSGSRVITSPDAIVWHRAILMRSDNTALRDSLQIIADTDIRTFPAIDQNTNDDFCVANPKGSGELCSATWGNYVRIPF